MSYRRQDGFTDSVDNQSRDEKYIHNNPGPYIAVVKTVSDPLRTGRLGVNIPALDPSGTSVRWVRYLPPFYGAKSIDATSETDPYNFKHTQHSYGMWAIPPDIGSEVLVIFAEGRSKESTAFWIGCVQQDTVNHMVPGNASSERTSLSVADVGDIGHGTEEKKEIYGTHMLPAGEKNQRIWNDGDSLESVQQWKLPINDILADQLKSQGLVEDTVRGTTTSSARRESPSQVFGWNTPGRIRPDSRVVNIGVKNAPIATDRSVGHSFVMDDGDVRGENQLIRLRTASGHQLLMHDTEGVVYIANGSGNAWIEMNKNGRIDVYSGVGGINLRTEGDFNLHSDANINMHAGGSIRMSASVDLIQSGMTIMNLGEHGVYTSAVNGPIRDYAKGGISSYTDGMQLTGAGGQIHLAGSQVHFNSTGASSNWGPTWLTKDAAGMAERDEGDVELANKGFAKLEQFSRNTKTTVHRFVTHEPMPRFSGFSSDGVVPYQVGGEFDDAMDIKMWSRLSSTPGTIEYIEQRNRISKIESIRLGQYQADAEKYLKIAMGNSTNSTKARELLEEYGKKYDKTFNVINQAAGVFDPAMSISNKIQNFDLKTTINDVKKNLTTQLTHQVIEKFKGNATNLFKDNILVNKAGQIFTIGESVHGQISSAGDAINQIKNIKGNLSIANIGSVITDVKTVTNIYNSVMGGNIIGMNVAKKIASKFGLYSSSVQQMHGQGLLGQIGANAGSFIKTAITKFFSDIRLKEDIQLIGKSQADVNIYRFKYKHTNGIYEGVIAQEVPWARKMTDTGFYMVDYSKLDVDFRRLI